MTNQNDQCAALSGIRICDFTGQLAGAGATRILATFGAQVIRVEDRLRQSQWDIFRGGEVGVAVQNPAASKFDRS